MLPVQLPFADLSAWSDKLPWALGALSAVVIFTFVGVLVSRRSAQRPTQRLTLEEVEPHHLYLQTSGEERRTTTRRKGAATPVRLSATTQPENPFSGWVMDRSLGGVKLEVESQVTRGWVLNVGLTDASGGEHGFQVEVVHCQQAGSRWHVGCRFVHVPPTEVLWLLG
jgi:hypothetical protein